MATRNVRSDREDDPLHAFDVAGIIASWQDLPAREAAMRALGDLAWDKHACWVITAQMERFAGDDGADHMQFLVVWLAGAYHVYRPTGPTPAPHYGKAKPAPEPAGLMFSVPTDKKPTKMSAHHKDEIERRIKEHLLAIPDRRRRPAIKP